MTINGKVIVVAVVTVLGISCAGAQEPAAARPEMDHSKMDHGAMSGPAPDTGHDMGGMDHGSMQGGSPPPDARDPHAYSGGYDFGPISPPRMGDVHNFHGLMIDRLERIRTRDNSYTEYDLQAWFGRDYDRAVLKAEGEVDGGRLHDARTELLWGHAIAAYWNTQLGVRHDGGIEPSRTWLAFGVQGLAPYWFEMDITGYIGEHGRTALSVEAEYELLLTQKLILQPRLEANFYGKRDAERELGSGLSDLVAGVRLRYEIRREFAPYVGVERSGKFGGTADFARDKGNQAMATRVVAGLRFWF
ncbi:MAG: copper resistance protein B [Sulfuricaulis sp.]|nr:copper resistance protein B [Sulfuricaulis sp.]